MEVSPTPLITPNFNEISKSLSDINQLEIIKNVTKPLNDIIGGFLNGGQGLMLPNLHFTNLNIKSLGQEFLSNPASSVNVQNISNNMNIGEIIDKSKEAFVLIAKILVAMLEIALWVLKGVLGFLT